MRNDEKHSNISSAFDIWRDEGVAVDPEYADKGLFKFTGGQLHKVVFDIE